MALIQHQGESPLPLGETAPGFSNLLATDGKMYSLTDIPGDKATVVVFTCNHCPYAEAYEDRLIELAHHFQPLGVGFVAINSNDASQYPADSFENMRKRAESKKFPFVYVHDSSQNVAKAFQAICTPHVFVIQDQLLVYRGRVDDNWKDPGAVLRPDLRNALQAILNHEPIPHPETHPMGCSIKWRWD